jgi:acyl dehydratase
MPGTFDRAQIGDRISSESLEIDQSRAEQMISWAGYVHPLFTDPEFASRAGFQVRPVPGELVLLLLGGMAEQTGFFDDTTIALVGLAGVRFRTPAAAGDSIRLEMDVVKKDVSGSGRRGFLTLKWTCRNEEDHVVLEADAVFAFRLE